MPVPIATSIRSISPIMSAPLDSAKVPLGPCIGGLPDKYLQLKGERPSCDSAKKLAPEGPSRSQPRAFGAPHQRLNRARQQDAHSPCNQRRAVACARRVNSNSASRCFGIENEGFLAAERLQHAGLQGFGSACLLPLACLLHHLVGRRGRLRLEGGRRTER
jgi:hypothetical protein